MMVGRATAAAYRAQQENDPVFQIKELRKEMNRRLDKIERKIDDAIKQKRG